MDIIHFWRHGNRGNPGGGESSPARRFRSAQVALYLVFSLVAIFVLALMAVDVFLAVRAKNYLQNAGDAAALAAAHRQGELINEIGLLNLKHIKAALEDNAEECENIVMEQHRLALIEPVFALEQADKAARANCLCPREEFSTILRNHINDVLTLYKGGSMDSYDPYPEPYPGAWDEYAQAIEAVLANGLATGVDNVEFYTVYGNHTLLSGAFYNAIASEDWCWFLFNAMSLLRNYNSFRDWSPLPIELNNTTDNSEIFSLFINAKKCALTDYFSGTNLIEMANKYGNMNIRLADYVKTKIVIGEDGTEMEVEEFDAGLLDDPKQSWFFFDPGRWGMWFNGKKLVSDGEDAAEYPIVGPVREAYNVAGCAAVCRTYDTVCSFATDTCNKLGWNAAAKPFGCIEDFANQIVPVTSLQNFVVPCMTDTRLVSVDSVIHTNLGTADPAWIRHVRLHLPDYMENGPRENGCIFCEQLQKWERISFRNKGLNWLSFNSKQCYRTDDPSSGSSKKKCCCCNGKGSSCPFCGGTGTMGQGGTYRGH